MIRGWYIGASGMAAQQNRLDAIANNLANVDTAGYKRDITVQKSFSELLLRRADFDGVYTIPSGSADAAPIIGKLGLGVETNENYKDFTQGSFRATSSNTDMALGGEGFFAVQTPDGERYTRNGNFMIGKEGILETKEGYPVLGENGIIHVTDDSFKVSEDGMIYASDTSDIIDRFKIVRFDNERYLKKQDSEIINRILRRLSGWERMTTNARFGPYGRQRGYKKTVSTKNNVIQINSVQTNNKGKG